MMSAWKELAQANGLSYNPGSFFNSGPQVKGSYRGHYIKLGLTNGNIHLTLWPQNASTVPLPHVEPPITSAIISEWLMPVSVNGSFGATSGGRTLSYYQNGNEYDKKRLKSLFDALSHLAEMYPKVLALGGEIAPALHEIAENGAHKLRHVALQLLKDISEETNRQFKRRAAYLLCPRCMARFKVHHLRLTWFINPGKINYYGCRICRQSRRYIEEKPILVLDNHMTKSRIYAEGTLRVNWLVERQLIDCDQVEIGQATDEEVERFAVQVGNNTDAVRKELYKNIPILILEDCNVSKNTLRILKSIFGSNLAIDVESSKE